MAAVFARPQQQIGTLSFEVTAGQVDEAMGKVNRGRAICRALVNEPELAKRNLKLVRTDFDGSNEAQARIFMFGWINPDATVE